MRSRHSRSARVLMVLTSLVTVWCLDCSAFEPLLGALLGTRSTMMACAGGGMAEMARDAAAVSDASPIDVSASIPHVSEPGNQREGFDCGCGGSCHAPDQTVSRPAAVHTVPAAIAVIEAIQPPSAVRVPLLPPPERAA